jgi:hypothetical protein
MQQRSRYVLVEAQIQPKLLGGRAAGRATCRTRKPLI